MTTVSAGPILAISANWQTRAFLTAQLGETCGCDVVSAPGVDEALTLIKIVGIQPAVELPDTPLVLIASALRRSAFDPLRKRCAAYLVRPVSIGRIAHTVAQLLRQ